MTRLREPVSENGKHVASEDTRLCEPVTATATQAALPQGSSESRGAASDAGASLQKAVQVESVCGALAMCAGLGQWAHVSVVAKGVPCFRRLAPRPGAAHGEPEAPHTPRVQQHAPRVELSPARPRSRAVSLEEAYAALDVAGRALAEAHPWPVAAGGTAGRHYKDHTAESEDADLLPLDSNESRGGQRNASAPPLGRLAACTTTRLEEPAAAGSLVGPDPAAATQHSLGTASGAGVDEAPCGEHNSEHDANSDEATRSDEPCASDRDENGTEEDPVLDEFLSALTSDDLRGGTGDVKALLKRAMGTFVRARVREGDSSADAKAEARSILQVFKAGVKSSGDAVEDV